MQIRLYAIAALAGACVALSLPATAAISGYGQLSGGGAAARSSTHFNAVCGLNQTCYTHVTAGERAFEGNIHVGKIFPSGFGLQFDAEANYYDAPTFQSPLVRNGKTLLTGYGVAAHFNYGDSMFRAGTILSVGTIGRNSWLISPGVEGELFLSKATLFAQALYTHSLAIPSYGGLSRSLQSAYLHTGVRYFYSPNLKFEGGAAAGLASYGDRNNIHAMLFSASAEYRLQNLPISLFAKYRFSYAKHHSFSPWSSYFGHDLDTINKRNLFMLGIRVYFDASSLIENDRNGTSMNDYNPWYGVNPFMRELFDSGLGLLPP